MRNGFSYIELVVVIGIVSLLSAFSVFSLLGLQTRSSAKVVMAQVLADVRAQQTKAMTSQQAGVYLNTNSYVLFNGDTFVAEEPANFQVDLSSAWELVTTFPDNKIVFERGSGEIENFSTDARSITLTHVSSGEFHSVTLNKYGATE